MSEIKNATLNLLIVLASVTCFIYAMKTLKSCDKGCTQENIKQREEHTKHLKIKAEILKDCYKTHKPAECEKARVLTECLTHGYRPARCATLFIFK